MATRTSPLVSAAVLASAAAIAVATPAIAPSVHLPSPHLLEAAKVQLTTFADVLTITPTDYSNIYFNGYGQAISYKADASFDWAAPYISTKRFCDYSCQRSGVSGLAYVVLDALINGNGTGYANVPKDPSKPYNPNTNPYDKGHDTWSVGALNYEFEGGFSPALEYVVLKPFADPTSKMYNQAVAQAIATAFQGTQNVSNIYLTTLNTIAFAALKVPLVGTYVYGSIQAYLGTNGYQPGLSGVLKYAVDVAANGGKSPIPLPVTGSGASVATLAAAAAPRSAAITPPCPPAPVVPRSPPLPPPETGDGAQSLSTYRAAAAAPSELSPPPP